MCAGDSPKRADRQRPRLNGWHVMDNFRNGERISGPTRRQRRFRLGRPSPFVLMILTALLFLTGAASFSGHGSKEMAELGVGGAVVAIATIAAFML